MAKEMKTDVTDIETALVDFFGDDDLCTLPDIKGLRSLQDIGFENKRGVKITTKSGETFEIVIKQI